MPFPSPQRVKIAALLIYLLRHAEAEDVSPTGRDGDRRLTDAGHRRMKAIARAIARLEIAPEEILVSPLVRARQTAEPVAQALGFEKPLRETLHLVPSAAPDAILDEIARLGRSSVLLVGHQPHLGRVAGRLLSHRSDAELPMKKAALAAFEVDGDPSLDDAELKLFVPPRVLEKLG